VLPPSAPQRLWLHPVARPLVSGLIRYYALRDAIEDRRLERRLLERRGPVSA
jgi:hypothetical protein